MKILLIINDPPYGTERCFNALRLVLAFPSRFSKLQSSIVEGA